MKTFYLNCFRFAKNIVCNPSHGMRGAWPCLPWCRQYSSNVLRDTNPFLHAYRFGTTVFCALLVYLCFLKVRCLTRVYCKYILIWDKIVNIFLVNGFPSSCSVHNRICIEGKCNFSSNISCYKLLLCHAVHRLDHHTSLLDHHTSLLDHHTSLLSIHTSLLDHPPHLPTKRPHLPTRSPHLQTTVDQHTYKLDQHTSLLAYTTPPLPPP